MARGRWDICAGLVVTGPHKRHSSPALYKGKPFHMALFPLGHLWYDSARFVNTTVSFSRAWELTHGDAHSAFR
jgi:hypothetical protein